MALLSVPVTPPPAIMDVHPTFRPASSVNAYTRIAACSLSWTDVTTWTNGIDLSVSHHYGGDCVSMTARLHAAMTCWLCEPQDAGSAGAVDEQPGAAADPAEPAAGGMDEAVARQRMQQWLPTGGDALAAAAREIQAGGTPVREHLQNSVQTAVGATPAQQPTVAADVAEPVALSADEELAAQRMKQWMPAGSDALAAAAREIQAEGLAADEAAAQQQAAGETAVEEPADDEHVRPAVHDQSGRRRWAHCVGR